MAMYYLCYVMSVNGGKDIPVAPAFNALQGWLNNIKTPELEQYKHDAEKYWNILIKIQMSKMNK